MSAVSGFFNSLEVAAACLIAYFIRKHWLKKRIENGEVQLSPDSHRRSEQHFLDLFKS